MRLFHVSEENDIEIFHPRIHERDGLDKTKPLVWAACERALPNFYVPRDCPRVTYHKNDSTSEEDVKRFLTSSTSNHAVIIENNWYEIMKNTTIYIYELNDTNFYLQDDIAGYYVSESIEIPINKFEISDLVGELVRSNVEFRIVDSLERIAKEIQNTTFNWSLCRMKNAKHLINSRR